MERLRRIVQRGLRRVDARYQRTRELQPVGPILFVGRAVYRGPLIRFDDQTALEPGHTVGMLHFNNERFTQIVAPSAAVAALAFARLMRQSMQDLAERAFRDPAFCDLSVFHAVSWLPAHGGRVGFVSQPLPDGWKRHLLATWFQVLVWAFAPAAQSRGARPDPHFYWLTRRALLDRFPVRQRPDA
jgi:hypothetical protein